MDKIEHKEQTIFGWLASDGWHRGVYLFTSEPKWDEDGWEYGCGGMWRVGSEEGFLLPEYVYPGLTKENSPVKVKLTLTLEPIVKED